MKARYVIGALVGAGIGMVLSYLYGQGEGAGLISNMGVGALIGALVGFYIVSATSASGRGAAAEEGGAEKPQIG